MNEQAELAGSVVRPVSRALERVEAASLELRAISAAFDREGVGAELVAALESMYLALESDVWSSVHSDALASAVSSVLAARRVLSAAGLPPLPAVGSVLDKLAEGEGWLRSANEAVAMWQLSRRMELRGELAPDGAEVPPFVASEGFARCHGLARGPLAPPFDFGENPEPEPSGAEIAAPESLSALKELAARLKAGGLEAGPAPEEARELGPSGEQAEVEAMAELAHDTLDAIAGLGMLREPGPTERWVDQAPFEQRLLDQLDYAASLGGMALRSVVDFHAEAEVPDPGRAFAVAFTLGCVSGRDTVDAAVAILKQSPPEELAGYASGFALAASPEIDAALARLSMHENSDWAAFALSVLGERAALPDSDALHALTQREAPVRRALAQAVRGSVSKERIELLLEPLLFDSDDDCMLAAAETLLCRGFGGVRRILRDVVDTIDGTASERRRQGAAWLLCLCGAKEDLARLLSLAQDSAAPRLVRGLGRFGHPAATSFLTSLLAGDDEAILAAAAGALERITGAGLAEEVELPWVEELPEQAKELEFPIPTRRVRRPSRDAHAWHAWLQAERDRFDPELKYRSGAPFQLAQVLAELESAETPPPERDEAALELELVLGGGARLRTREWVARQRSALDGLRPEGARYTSAGQYAYQLAGKRTVASVPAVHSGFEPAAAPVPRATNWPERREFDRADPEPAPLHASFTAPAAPSPIQQPAPQLIASGELSLEQFAHLVASLEREPGRARELLAQHGFEATGFAAEQARFHERFMRDSELVERYEYLLRLYRTME